MVLTGYTTEGSYSVLLPDGRIMTVTYSVPDTETGFLAEVSYEVDLSRILLKIERESFFWHTIHQKCNTFMYYYQSWTTLGYPRIGTRKKSQDEKQASTALCLDKNTV